LLTERDLSAAGDTETFLVWDERSNGMVSHRSDRGYAKDGIMPALLGSHKVTLAGGQTIECRPAFQLLTEIAARYVPEQSETETWVRAPDVRRAVRLFAAEKPSCYYSWSGIEQQSDATQTNRAICLFYALTGQFDQRGGNLLCANTPTDPITGHELLSPEQRSRRLGANDRPLGPPGIAARVQAYDVYRAILTGDPYPVKALVTFGSDPLVGNGDTRSGKRALEALDFFAHVDVFPNASAAFADLLLPAATCWEREGLMPSFPGGEDNATWAQLRPAVIRPLHESRSDLEIVFDLAHRLSLKRYFFDGDIDAGYNHHLAPSGITIEKLRANRIGMRAAVMTRYRKDAEVDAQTGRPRGFATPTGKIEIYSTTFAKAGYPPMPERDGALASGPTSEEYPLILTTFRLMQFCDQQHRNIPRLRRQAREPLLQVNPETATALHILENEWIRLETATGGIRLKAKLNSSLHPKVVATQYGWWQACPELGLPGYDHFSPEGANVNLIISNDALDPISGAVPHRSQPCRVRKLGA
jgi:anaerobic selenocysteine-containing dehydrogenase